jgi:hypothetical protein
MCVIDARRRLLSKVPTKHAAYLDCSGLLLLVRTSILPGLLGSGSGASGGVENEVLPDRQVREEYVYLMDEACSLLCV